MGGAKGGTKSVRKKHHVPAWDMAWQRDGVVEITKPAPIDYVKEVEQSKDAGAELAQEIIASRREISRIKSQMKLSSNREALNAMEVEISRIEEHLKKEKQESEESLLMLLLT